MSNLNRIPVTPPKHVPDIITPLPIIPCFDLAANLTLTTISTAIITINKGYQTGDILELDSNLTLVNMGDQTKIENTNITVVHGGFNKETKQLVLCGDDSPATYEEVLSSLLLDNPAGLDGTLHEISFVVLDDEHVRHFLGKTILDCSMENGMNHTILDEINDDGLLRSLFEQYFGHLSHTAENDQAATFAPKANSVTTMLGYGQEEISLTIDSATAQLKLVCVSQKNPSLAWQDEMGSSNSYAIQERKVVFSNNIPGSLVLSDGTSLEYKKIDVVFWL